MIRNRFILRGLAVFFLLETVSGLVAPAVSWALTSGPTAPEATSFEPVDTTDMVNLSSGDFVYNLPLLEVPGPAGSYPLSLSYHAGIQPNEEASWVGLGFTLNPGAVTRNVNGYPDDFKGISNVDRQFWEGGRRETYNIGISYGIAESPANVGFGLSFSQDTYQGFGVGGYGSAGVMAPVSEGLGINMSATIGVSPYGGSYSSMGTGLGLRASENSALRLNAGLNYGLNSGFQGSVGVSTMARNSVSASISSNGNFNAGVRGSSGYSSVDNYKAGSISTKSSSFGIDIPVNAGLSISLGYNYVRYWSDETARVATNGSLYYPQQRVDDFDNRAYDSYALLPTSANLTDSPIAEEQLGGSFPDHDNYFVMAQGLSGAIRPFTYKGLIFRQSRKRTSDQGGGYNTKQYAYRDQEYIVEKTAFGFVNDFSNRFVYGGGQISLAGNESTDGGIAPVNVGFDNSQQTGDNGSNGYVNNHLVGSRHIEWYTNREILTNTEEKDANADGFLDCIANGFDRWTTNQDQIGGFMITNESGVTYHYALPVYTKNEFVYSENTDKSRGNTYNSLSRPEPYAYTWLLTSVTGPDFVDRNGNNLADAGDWGYWINFTYSKYASNYSWRNPSEGYHPDLDNKFRNYSSGQKEIYYLESIRSTTHVAVFEKSERFDSKEVTDLSKGGFEPQQITTAEGTSFLKTKSAMRLDRIKLYKAEDYYATRLGDDYLVRAIEFTYDYSLVPKTSNSFNSNNPLEKFGKLTLLSVDYLGKGGKGKGLIPPIKFEYELNDEPIGNASVASTDGKQALVGLAGNTNLTGLEYGDIISFTQAGDQLYAYVGNYSASTNAFDIWSISGVIKAGAMANIKRTKNPPYNADSYDIWNYYKPDVPERNDYYDENGRRTVSAAGAKNVDVWSLRRIKNSIGNITEIEYESDDYSKVGVGSPFQFEIVWATATTNVPDKLNIGVGYVDDFSNFRVNDVVDLLLVINSPTAECGEFLPHVQRIDGVVISAINSSGIELTNPGIGSLISRPGCILNNFIAGHLGLHNNVRRLGGGIRVKSVALVSSTSTRKTSYSYSFGGCAFGSTSCQSSGVTSYEPFTLGSSIQQSVDRAYKINYQGDNGFHYDDDDYNRIFYSGGTAKLLAVARELPPPGVLYGEVRVSESVTYGNDENVLPNISVYEYQTFDQSMVNVVTLKPYQETPMWHTYDDFEYTSVGLKDIAIKDYTTRIGNLKKISLYNGNQKVSESEYRYLHDQGGDYDEAMATYSRQGVIQETFIDMKFQHQAKVQGIVSRRHTYPTILKEKVNTNYLTGMTTSTITQAFDFYSGQPSQTLTTDSYGNRFLSSSTAAYWHYPKMQSKVYDIHNKNMLTQGAEAYSYVVNSNNEPTGLLSASIQTWSDDVAVVNLDGGNTQPNIWRKKSSFQWQSAMPLEAGGVANLSELGSYPFEQWTGDADPDSRWELVTSNTLFDGYSHELEAYDINGNYSAVRMTPDQIRVSVAGPNARYGEISFSGAEYFSGNSSTEGNINRGSGNPSKARAHTGSYSLLVAPGSKGFAYTLEFGKADLNKKYRASVWVYSPGESETQAELNTIKLTGSISGQEVFSVSPTIQKSKSKSWYLLTLDLQPNGTDPLSITVSNGSSRGVYFDDFRIHPLACSSSAYVYNEITGELNYILDANNLYTRFEYDELGRLIRTSKELLNFDFGPGKESYRADAVLNEIKYNYAKEK